MCALVLCAPLTGGVAIPAPAPSTAWWLPGTWGQDPVRTQGKEITTPIGGFQIGRAKGGFYIFTALRFRRWGSAHATVRGRARWCSDSGDCTGVHPVRIDLTGMRFFAGCNVRIYFFYRARGLPMDGGARHPAVVNC